MTNLQWPRDSGKHHFSPPIMYDKLGNKNYAWDDQHNDGLEKSCKMMYHTWVTKNWVGGSHAWDDQHNNGL